MAISYQVGDKDTRPWGTWEVIAVGETYIVKKIVVHPKGVLSLQSHRFRSEHWIIASGTAEITLEERIWSAPANTHIFIDIAQKHRIANRTDVPMTFIEVQTGQTLDESDIIRYEDIYGRTA